MFKAIHQFHSGVTHGDAISNQMFSIQSELRAMGYLSEIFAEHYDGDLKTSVKHVDELMSSTDELLLIHHSMGHLRLDQILNFSNSVVTVYHNITPADQLTDIGFKHFSHIGRNQLDVLAKRSLLGIADSHYNRKEMIQRGFTQVEVIPVRTNFREFQAARETRHPEQDWLFVGRLSPNKQQIKIVQAFSHYHHNFNPSARLFLVGSHDMRTYTNLLGKEIETLGLKGMADPTGKIEDVDLVHRYSRAGVFVSLSLHEGFGVPLLEAMAAGVPVVALDSSAVTETMAGAGVLLPSSEPEMVSNAVHRLMTDPQHREEIIWRQDRRLEKITGFNVQMALQKVLDLIEGKTFPTKIQIQGPIESSYSLAILNRETALQLSHMDKFSVSVYPTEGPGDYRVDTEAIEQIPHLKALYSLGLETPYPDVVIRQMFPPRVNDSTGKLTLQYFGWEESLVPQQFVEDFNLHVDRIMTMSTFVRDALVNSGVTIPIDVVGVGVRAPQSEDPCAINELQDLRKTRLLHISSAFPRKGIDVLLTAYFAEFTGEDEISLIIKTFPNQHNDIDKQIEQLNGLHLNPPHLVLINRDLGLGQLGHLYIEANAYVHPARGEGFGLPVAEAMLSNVPVISTATSGLSDFVNSSTAAVIPSFLVTANSHVSIPGSEWFEPDLESLRREMRSVYRNSESDVRAERVRNAKELIETDFSWNAVGNRIQTSIHRALDIPPSIKVTQVTTFNSRCGIAEYSSLLQNSLPKNVMSSIFADRGVAPINLDVEEDVVRIWEQVRHQDVTTLATALQLSDADVVHIQYNFGFFSMEDLSELIELLDGFKPIIITLHRTKDLDRGHEIVSLSDAAEALQKVNAIIVHEQHDVHRLLRFGISANVRHIPHAAMPFRGVRKHPAKRLEGELKIGTFGFLLPHKGLEISIQALQSLQSTGLNVSLKALCSLHPDPSSTDTHRNIISLIQNLGLSDVVSLDTNYKSVEEIHNELSEVDVLVLPYSATEESSSGVLAMLLGIGKPIIATDLDIFEGVRDAISVISAPANSQDLLEALVRLAYDPDLLVDLGRKASKKATELAWGTIGRQTEALYSHVVRENALKTSNK